MCTNRHTTSITDTIREELPSGSGNSDGGNGASRIFGATSDTSRNDDLANDVISTVLKQENGTAVLGTSWDTILSQCFAAQRKECAFPVPLDSRDCPVPFGADVAAGVLPCDRVHLGELCEGNGECGTSNALNNCGQYDVYRNTPSGVGVCAVLLPTGHVQCGDSDAAHAALKTCLGVEYGSSCRGDDVCTRDDELPIVVSSAYTLSTTETSHVNYEFSAIVTPLLSERAKVHFSNLDKCSDGSSSRCQSTEVTLRGTFSPGGLVHIRNGLTIRKSSDKNSCPLGWKLLSPRSREDWLTVCASTDACRNKNMIVDITKPEPGGKYTDGPMKSDAPGAQDWTTTDGTAWWLRDSPYGEPNGDYTANCFLGVRVSKDGEVITFNDMLCAYESSTYLCQPQATTPTKKLWSATEYAKLLTLTASSDGALGAGIMIQPQSKNMMVRLNKHHNFTCPPLAQHAPTAIRLVVSGNETAVHYNGTFVCNASKAYTPAFPMDVNGNSLQTEVGEAFITTPYARIQDLQYGAVNAIVSVVSTCHGYVYQKYRSVAGNCSTVYPLLEGTCPANDTALPNCREAEHDSVCQGLGECEGTDLELKNCGARSVAAYTVPFNTLFVFTSK